jgi:hypothetical protein
LNALDSIRSNKNLTNSALVENAITAAVNAAVVENQSSLFENGQNLLVQSYQMYGKTSPNVVSVAAVGAAYNRPIQVKIGNDTNSIAANSDTKTTQESNSNSTDSIQISNSSSGVNSDTDKTNKQSSVCTLSTTSSSCMSDEGCYGSSDFSSERDSHAFKLRQYQQQQKQKILMKQQISNESQYNQIILNTNENICQSNMSNTYGQNQTATTTSATAAVHSQITPLFATNLIKVPHTPSSVQQNKTKASPSLREQQNYCITNMSRFEKIYNNSLHTSNISNEMDTLSGEAVLPMPLLHIPPAYPATFTESSGPLLFQNKLSHAIDLNDNQSQENNHQIIQSISGSYV